MVEKKKNLSDVDTGDISAQDMSFGVVVSEWNSQVTEALAQGAVERLLSAGCPEENIVVKRVPGAFELPLGAQFFIEYGSFDAIIVLGCVVRGDTPHFDYVCSGCTQGVMKLTLDSSTPIGFGLLTVDTMQQALDRCGGVHGNKGDEAAATVLKMVALQREMFEEFEEFDGEEDFDDDEFMISHKSNNSLS